MKRSFPKPNLQTWHRHFKLISWNGAYRVLKKSSSYIYITAHICIHVHTYTYICTIFCEANTVTWYHIYY